MTRIAPEDTGSDSGVKQINAARQGDESALGAALEGCRAYLKQIAKEELGRDLQAKEDASDLVQATLLKAQHKFRDFQGQDRDALRLWLRQILINTLRDLFRKYQGGGKRNIAKEVRLDGSSNIQRSEGLVAADPTPSKIVMEVEREEALKNALTHLPDDQRRVIYLRSRKHLGFPEIGKIMNRSPDAARLLWYRAVERLAVELRQE